MRLIDADELIERIEKWMPKDPCGREQTVEEIIATDIAVSVCMEIEEAPTAFDKEKVIEKINREIEYHHEKSKIASMEIRAYSDGAERAYHLLRSIVEKGGIE